jgi:hypothetical protein
MRSVLLFFAVLGLISAAEIPLPTHMLLRMVATTLVTRGRKVELPQGITFDVVFEGHNNRVIREGHTRKLGDHQSPRTTYRSVSLRGWC